MKQFYWSPSGAVFLLLSCTCLATKSSLVSADDIKTLYIGGLFPITGSSTAWDGKSLLDISEEAINMVNNRSDILPGYQLQLFWNDTKCDPGHATDVLYNSLYFRKPMIAVLGAACQSVTRAITQSGRNWNLLQVSYSLMASDLSNKDKFPLLFSTVPPSSAENAARLAFLRYFRWKRIATIRQNEYVFNEVMHMFQENLLNDGFDLIAAEIFSDDPKSSIESLKTSDARIIVGMFDEDNARKVLCEAFKQDIYGENYVWLLLDWYDNKRWWQVKDNEVRCTVEQMTRAVEGYFSIESARIVPNKEPTVAKTTSEQFLQTYGAANNNRTELYVPFAFDSVWLIALTLNNSMHEVYTKLNRSLEDFNYKDSAMVKILKNTLRKLEFRGVTGNVKFTNKGERTRPTCIKQLQGGFSKVVAMFYPETNKTVFSGTKVVWQGNGPPLDGKVTIYEVQYISTPLFCVIVIFTSAGILLGLSFLWFNIEKRNYSYIKSSSPNVNNLVVLGCLFIYISVYMIAIDGMRADTDDLLGLCIVRGYLLSIGYSLAVGGMFSKTWRVYQIFSNIKPKRKIFSNWELTGLILILAVLDILVMSLWVGVDTPEILTINLESQVREEANQRTIPQHQYCTSKYLTTWLYILLGYKLLLLLVGCFIAWVTRKAKVHSLNDSRFVSLSVCTVVLCVIVGIPLSFLISDHVNALVACISFILLLASTVTLCLLFIPKIIKLKKSVEEDLHRLQSLSSTGSTPSKTRGTSSSSSGSQRAEDPNVVMRLQEEITTLKREIRTIKEKYNEKETSKLSVKVADPIENGRAGRTISPSPRPSPRPQLGKRSVTCNAAKELGVKIRGTKRSSSFSGPYWHGRSLDLGSLYSDFADPVLVLKAENKELHRKLQEARISESGKLAKVLYENAQLNRRIIELNIKNAPSDEAEKVSRLVKENAELKKQLGEVSILNSVWCDTTPSLKRKEREDRKISKELRELQHLLSVDLGGRRPGSFKQSPPCRPPSIGRSQSSTDIKCYRNSWSSLDKKTTTSTLAKDDTKRFSFEGAGRKQNLCSRDSRTDIQVTVTDTEKSPTQSKTAHAQSKVMRELDDASPNTVRRGNMDCCESEKENFDIKGTTNVGFSDEDDCVPDAVFDVKDFNICKGVPNECSVGDSKKRIPVHLIEEPVKGSMKNGVVEGCNYWTAVSVDELLKETSVSKEPKNSTKTQDNSEELGGTLSYHMMTPAGTKYDTTPGPQKGPLFPSNPDQTVSPPDSDFGPHKNKHIPSSLVLANLDAAIDKNGNLKGSGQGKDVFENINKPVPISSKEGGKDKSIETTLFSSGHDAYDSEKERSLSGGNPKDVPAYKRKQNRRAKENPKPGKIEKTYFV